MSEDNTGKLSDCEPAPCDHEWHLVDDSFDHEFGTKIVVYEECELCGERREPEPCDPDYDRCDYEDRNEALEWGGMNGY